MPVSRHHIPKTRAGQHKRTGVAGAREGVPALEANLSDDERTMLIDPEWITEDEADAIISARREKEPGKRYSLEEVLRENGLSSLER